MPPLRGCYSFAFATWQEPGCAPVEREGDDEAPPRDGPQTPLLLSDVPGPLPTATKTRAL